MSAAADTCRHSATFTAATHCPVCRGRRTQLAPGDKIRHVTTGHLGVLDRYGAGRDWALVRWDPVEPGEPTGPGMVNGEGLSLVAPRMIERAPDGRR